MSCVQRKISLSTLQRRAVKRSEGGKKEESEPPKPPPDKKPAKDKEDPKLNGYAPGSTPKGKMMKDKEALLTKEKGVSIRRGVLG